MCIYMRARVHVIWEHEVAHSHERMHAYACCDNSCVFMGVAGIKTMHMYTNALN